ncbi:MAG: sugar ABC transporter permease [Catenulispora sp.]|nr:sugar ABC transporter permease [Catenulispora sp.]
MTSPSQLAQAAERPVRAVRPRSGRRSPRHRRHGLIALLFLFPLLLFYGTYYIYSFVFLARVSRQQVSLSFVDAVDVGWQNFRLVATDTLFQHAVINNLIFAAVSIAAALTIGFVAAMMLATGVRLHRTLYVILLLPSLIPLSLFATIFGKMLGTQYGAFNGLLRGVGLSGLQQDWLGQSNTAYAAVAVLLIYLIGLPIMYYRSDIESVNLSLVEAAVLDGAGTWRVFRSLLFPLLRNTHKTVVLSVLLGSFRAFDVIFFSTNGAPSGQTSITGTYIYNKTLAGTTVGYASAAALLLLLIAFVISAVQLVLMRRESR